MIKMYRFEVLLLLTLTIVFCVSLFLMRCAVTGTTLFAFLNWNLFLAVIPWVLSSQMVQRREQLNRYSFGAIALSWLLFFPNSPYILTDLFHLHNNTGMPVWFDLILILAYAWAGLLFGFMSLFHIESMLLEKLSIARTRVIIVALLFLSCFGVYMGRFLRWNSWDVVSDPMLISRDIIDRFIHPMEHLRTWGLTILMGSLLSLIYYSVKMLMNGSSFRK